MIVLRQKKKSPQKHQKPYRLRPCHHPDSFQADHFFPGIRTVRMPKWLISNNSPLFHQGAKLASILLKRKIFKLGFSHSARKTFRTKRPFPPPAPSQYT